MLVRRFLGLVFGGGGGLGFDIFVLVGGLFGIFHLGKDRHDGGGGGGGSSGGKGCDVGEGETKEQARVRRKEAELWI